MYFSLRQVPEWKHLSKVELRNLNRGAARKVLHEGRTLLGLFTIAILATPFVYYSIVCVDAEPLSTILTVITSGCAGFVMSQWHIHRMRIWFRNASTGNREVKG